MNGSGGAPKMGGNAGKMARAQAAEPKMKGRGTSMKKTELKNTGLKGGISALRKDHGMKGGNTAGKMPK